MSRRVIIVCGGRDHHPGESGGWWLRGIVDALEIDTIRHGDASGVDRWAGGFARHVGLFEEPVPADWATHKRRAGPIRNRAMLKMAARPLAVVAFVGGRGTFDMVMAARAASVRAIEHPDRTRERRATGRQILENAALHPTGQCSCYGEMCDWCIWRESTP